MAKKLIKNGYWPLWPANDGSELMDNENRKTRARRFQETFYVILICQVLFVILVISVGKLTQFYIHNNLLLIVLGKQGIS